MARERTGQGGTLRGFASMEQEKQREIARKGGANVPHEKRSFAQNRSLAAEAGRKGGQTSQSRRHAKTDQSSDTSVKAPGTNGHGNDHLKLGSERQS